MPHNLNTFPVHFARPRPIKISNEDNEVKPVNELISHYDLLVKLLPKIQTANIYHGTGMGRHEVRHCTFLYWLLNPSASHAHGGDFLNIFLSHLESKLPKKAHLSAVVTREHSKGKFGRMDITIIVKDLLYIVIEAKTDSKDSAGQLSKYKDALIADDCYTKYKKCMIVYLTASGGEPEHGEADICMSWQEISEMVKKFSKECRVHSLSVATTEYAKYLNEVMYEF